MQYFMKFVKINKMESHFITLSLFHFNFLFFLTTLSLKKKKEKFLFNNHPYGLSFSCSSSNLTETKKLNFKLKKYFFIILQCKQKCQYLTWKKKEEES